MASTTLPGTEIYDFLSELAGRKAGLALGLPEIIEHLAGGDLPPTDGSAVRIRHEEVEALARRLLYRLGALEFDDPYSTPAMSLWARFRDDTKSAQIVETILEEFMSCFGPDFEEPDLKMPTAVRASSFVNLFDDAMDITPMFKRVVAVHGEVAMPILLEFHARLTDHLTGSILSKYRRTEWTNAEVLRDLFNSEGVNPAHGAFIDQRFVDYLARNFDAVDSMNWRKFEGLTAEYFHRAGCRVEVGKGRADGGVDVRVWRPDAPAGASPLILVQCKRQKSKVGKVVVKALWADVEHEEAESGLIVTTNALEPGALETAIARSYSVSAIERTKLKSWIETLRTPGTGMVLR